MSSACFEIKVPPNNIGRLAIIDVDGKRVCGTVIDLVHGTDTPKRIRIQHGLPELNGDVVQPHEYTFLYWANEDDD